MCLVDILNVPKNIIELNFLEENGVTYSNQSKCNAENSPKKKWNKIFLIEQTKILNVYTQSVYVAFYFIWIVCKHSVFRFVQATKFCFTFFSDFSALCFDRLLYDTPFFFVSDSFVKHLEFLYIKCMYYETVFSVVCCVK